MQHTLANLLTLYVALHVRRWGKPDVCK